MFRCAFICLIICGIAAAAPNCIGSLSSPAHIFIGIQLEHSLSTIPEAVQGTSTVPELSQQKQKHIPEQTNFTLTKTYHLSDNGKVSWMEAYHWCKLANMTLATIKSEEENEKVYEAIKAKHPNDPAWLGAVDLKWNRDFRWMPNNEEFGYVNWGANEPNNIQTKENCLEFMPSSKKWNDNVCSTQRIIVCEKME